VYKDTKVRNSELFQILLLDNLYSLSGSDHFFFQGGTAIRWIYGGTRFSEDLDFVTHLPVDNIKKIISNVSRKIHNACVAQFGPGQSEQKQKKSRKDAVETPEEILTDKIRAVYERTYIKGRDIYDIWWLTKQHHVKPSWPITRAKLEMYKADFFPAREAGYFQQKKNAKEIISALNSDLPRFIPKEIYSVYQENDFKELIDTFKSVIADLLGQGLKDYLDHYERK